MVYGSIYNEMLEDQIAVLPDILGEVLRFFKTTDLAAHEPGCFDLTLGGVPLVLQVLDLKTVPRESLRPEIHRRTVDVQFLAAGGPEEAGYYYDDGSSEIDEDLLETPRDILFYKYNKNAAEGRIRMDVGTYAVYFPWDVHIPAIQADGKSVPIRKIVVKVPLDACTRRG